MSIKESGITTSPGLIPSFSDPQANDTMTCVQPSSFRAQIFAR